MRGRVGGPSHCQCLILWSTEVRGSRIYLPGGRDLFRILSHVEDQGTIAMVSPKKMLQMTKKNPMVNLEKILRKVHRKQKNIGDHSISIEINFIIKIKIFLKAY
jgi:hypothetical protein